MKNKYPFLYLWKHENLSSFPSIPFDQIIAHYKDLFWKWVKDPDSIYTFIPTTPSLMISESSQSILDIYFYNEMKPSILNVKNQSNPPVNESLMKMDDDAFDEYLNKLFKKWIFKTTKTLFQAEATLYGLHVMKAREQIINGEKKQTVLKDLGNKVLLSPDGGKSIFSEDQFRTLKSVYLELKECIKEIRRRMDIPLKSDPGYIWRTDESENIITLIPDTTEILFESELKCITERSSVAGVAAEILVCRLNKCYSTGLKSGRSLKNIIDNVPQFFPV